MTDPDDDTLVRMACQGNAGAFEALVLRHYDLIFRIAYKWCGHRENAEDIAQDACVRLAGAIHGYQGRAAFTSWLYRVVVNCAIDAQRRAGKKGYVPDGQDVLDGLAGDAPRADEALYAKQLMRAVRALPEKQKAAVLLVLSEGLSHREAASIMKCRESTVSWHIFEARKTLAAYEKGKIAS